jgi:hypothetical protein
MRRTIVIAALLLAGCCIQERETLAELRAAAGPEDAEAVAAAESSLGNCVEREAQVAAILIKVIGEL